MKTAMGNMSQTPVVEINLTEKYNTFCLENYRKKNSTNDFF